MDKMDILKQIDEKTNYYKNLDYPPQYYYCKDKFKKNSSKSIEFVENDIYDILSCIHIINHPDIPIEDSLMEINSFYDFVGSFDLRSLVKLHKICNSLPKEEVISFLNSSRNTDNNDFNISNASSYSDNLDSFINMYQNDKDYLFCILTVYIAHSELGPMWQLLKRKYKNKEAFTKFQDFIKARTAFTTSIDLYDDIFDYIREIEMEKSLDDKKVKKLELLKNSFLKICDNEEINNYKDILSYSRDFLDLQKEILLFIYLRNSKYESKQRKYIGSFNNKENSKYLFILNKLDISYDGDIDDFSYLDIHDFETIIDILRRLLFSNEEIINILKNTSMDNISLIEGYINRGIISKDFVSNNLDIFKNYSTKLDIIVENVEYFQSIDINPYIFRNNSYILLQDINLNKKVINIIMEYDLVSSLKKTLDISFFNDDTINNKIDTLLEMGFEDFLEEDLRLLNYDNYDRIKLLLELGVKFNTCSDVIKVLEKKDFMIDDSKIEEYLPNSSVIMDEVDLDYDLLSNYSNTKRTYMIGDFIISKRRVNKSLEEGNSLFSIIFDEKNVSMDDYDNITSNLVKK